MNVQAYDPSSPLPVQRAFHTSQARYRAYIGGFGSGKTKAGCWEAIILSLQYPGNLGVICRGSYPELRDTTRRTFFEVLAESSGGDPADPESSPLVRKFYWTENRLVFRNGGKGVPDSEILFRSLESVEKFKSLELGFFYIDEASEIREEAFLILSGRLRRSGIGRHCGFLTSNPSTTRHWIYDRWVASPAGRDYDLFRAPSSENPYLPDGYIKQLREDYPDDWVKRYLDGEFGFIAEGERVYPEFSESVHVQKSEYNPQLPLVRSWDFGLRHPAVVIGQIDGDRLIILREIMGKDELIEDFAKGVTSYCGREFGQEGVVYEDYCDPAGNQMSDKSPKTSVDILRGLGIYPRSRQQFILDGVLIVRMLLRDRADGKPGLTVDPGCRMLIEGFLGGYHYPKKYDGSGEDPKPEKDGYYDHLQDCVRYLVWNTKFRTWLPVKTPKPQDVDNFKAWQTFAQGKGREDFSVRV